MNSLEGYPGGHFLTSDLYNIHYTSVSETITSDLRQKIYERNLAVNPTGDC